MAFDDPPNSINRSGNQTADFSSIDQYNNPFYLHPSDNPGNILVSTPLTGDNYATWRRAVIIALTAKKKLSFVDGSLPQPASDSPNLQSWTRCNTMVISWLLNSISKEICESIIYADLANTIWQELEERFSQGNAVKVYELRQAIVMNSQEQQSVVVYYNKLKALWDELSFYVVLPTCTCGAMKEFSNIQQQEKLMQFLMGLNDSYGSVRSQILLKDPLPAVNKAYSLMLREEKQRDILSKSSQNGNFATSTFYSQKVRDNPSSNGQRTNYNSKPKRGRPYCDHCQKLGHTKDRCYVLHGFPSTPRANHVQATPLVDSPTIAPPLTLEQYNQLVSLLGSNSNPLQLGNSSTSASANFAANLVGKHFFDSHTWIIDTGATNHMTCSVNNLSNPISTPYLSPVTLPTGPINLEDNWSGEA
ncbi:hypothetical protein SLEP1_g17617 [Rubroshorea leprosula]|uniref:Retrotransposon Copia-like N-terminal domain-containing protein n=1 Tax=Rubroshorea leprosula TaxID=152421 RepID=A0AAV5J433_9ROSI|nr:hypothetical protein SLEP1_g17617 [Rubroshorea leprosula]